MGMDVYGLNPKINHKVDIPPAPWDMKYKTPYKELSEEEQKERTEVTDKYFDACRENEEKNKGVYFRNNVWWWRPLWGYVNVVCDCLTDKDFIGGTDNSGYKISKTIIYSGEL